MPSAAKYWSTSTGVGAAPMTNSSHCSRPSARGSPPARPPAPPGRDAAAPRAPPSPSPRRAARRRRPSDAPRARRHHVARVRAARDAVAVGADRRVLRRPAVGDVRAGQERDHAPVGLSEPWNSSSAAQLGEHVGVRRLDALGRARRARGVDQREDVVGPDRAPARLEVEVRVAGRAAPSSSTSTTSGPAADALGERALDDRDPVAGVAEQVVDLLGRARVVDAERRRAEVDRREVHDVELGPVDHHQPDGVARPDAERGAGRAPPLDLFAQLRVGQLGRAVRRTDSDRVPHPLRGDLERLAQRARIERVGTRGLALLDGGHNGVKSFIAIWQRKT